MEQRRINVAKLKSNSGQIEGVPSNPREWTKEDVSKLAKSIEQTPELLEARGIIVYPHNGDYIVMGGNMRLAAIKQLGLKDAPCIVLPEDMSTDKLREIIIKDNGAFGHFDFDALGNEWDDLPLNDWGVDIPKEWGRSKEASTKPLMVKIVFTDADDLTDFVLKYQDKVESEFRCEVKA